MGELVELQVKDAITAQETVVKEEVEEIVLMTRKRSSCDSIRLIGKYSCDQSMELARQLSASATACSIEPITSR